MGLWMGPPTPASHWPLSAVAARDVGPATPHLRGPEPQCPTTPAPPRESGSVRWPCGWQMSSPAHIPPKTRVSSEAKVLDSLKLPVANSPLKAPDQPPGQLEDHFQD